MGIKKNIRFAREEIEALLASAIAFPESDEIAKHFGLFPFSYIECDEAQLEKLCANIIAKIDAPETSAPKIGALETDYVARLQKMYTRLMAEG